MKFMQSQKTDLWQVDPANVFSLMVWILFHWEKLPWFLWYSFLGVVFLFLSIPANYTYTEKKVSSLLPATVIPPSHSCQRRCPRAVFPTQAKVPLPRDLQGHPSHPSPPQTSERLEWDQGLSLTRDQPGVVTHLDFSSLNHSPVTYPEVGREAKAAICFS